jgi:hypothetical protein
MGSQDPVEEYISTLPTGYYFIVPVTAGDALSAAADIVRWTSPWSATYEIFPASSSYGQVDRAILVIGALDDHGRDTVADAVKSTFSRHVSNVQMRKK